MDYNFCVSSDLFNYCFEKHYFGYLARFSNRELVEVESNLSKLIDSDLFSDCILADEIIKLYDFVRDECVKRLSDIAK